MAIKNTNSNPLLDLSTKIERKHITIDGQKYLLRNMSEFNLIERHEIALAGKVMQGMSHLGEEGAEAQTAIESARQELEATIKRLLIDADKAVDQLTDEQRLVVLNCFFEQMGATPQQVARITAKQLKQQRVSKGSTVDEAKTG